MCVCVCVCVCVCDRERERERERECADVCLFVFYGISIFEGYLMPDTFLYECTVLFQTIQFSISTTV